MQMCPDCGKIYDESDFSHCPYCSGEIEEEKEIKIKFCSCGSYMIWDGDCWICVNCDNEIHSDEDDYDSIMSQ